MPNLRAYRSQFLDATDGAPIELDAAPDAVDARAEHHRVAAGELDVVFHAVVGEVQVVSGRGPLGRHRVNLLDPRGHTQFTTRLSHH